MFERRISEKSIQEIFVSSLERTVAISLLLLLFNNSLEFHCPKPRFTVLSLCDDVARCTKGARLA
jgi:hypothetical protein